MAAVMKMAALKNSILAAGLLFLVCSCDKKRAFDEYKELDGTWNKDSIFSFNYDSKDTVGLYNLFVTMRNNNSYPYSNIFLIVQMEQPGTKLIKADTLEYMVANPDGSLMGGGFSDVKESKLWYKEKLRFPKAGNYKFTISQAVRKAGKVPGVQELDGVTEVGLRIETTE
jgi:gliding motility-associated lipoprotein GldH